MTDLITAARQAREALERIATREAPSVLPWTHEAAADAYATMLHADRTDARKALSALDAAFATASEALDPAAIRRTALEEAAQVARTVADKHWDAEDDLRMAGALDAETAIRALKEDKG